MESNNVSVVASVYVVQEPLPHLVRLEHRGTSSLRNAECTVSK